MRFIYRTAFILTVVLVTTFCNKHPREAAKATQVVLQAGGAAYDSIVDKPQSNATGTIIPEWLGTPTANEPLVILPKTGFVNGYSTAHHNPAWTAYRLHAIPNPKSDERPGEFFPDPADRLNPNERVQTSEYTGSGYDRGHMAPNWAISINYGRKAQEETFVTTNICPQTPDCNRGLWQTLEKLEANRWAGTYKEITTFTGPIYGRNPEKLKNSKNQKYRIDIPIAFYKIIVRGTAEAPVVIAFIIPQKPQSGNQDTKLVQYLASVDEVESNTGINFFPNLPADTQNQIEAMKPTGLWK